MWQQPSKRRTASGQWLQEEESLAAVIARQYHALPEPDESDKKTFDLHFAVGLLLAQGKSHQAGILFKELTTRMERAQSSADSSSDDDASGELPDIDPEPVKWNTMESIADSSKQRELDRLESIKSAKEPGPLDQDPDLEEHRRLVNLDALLQRKTTPIEGYDDVNAGPMGQAEPVYTGCTFPGVEIDFSVPGHFRIKPTQAVHVAHHRWSLVPVGTHSLGIIDSVAGDLVSTSSGQARKIAGASRDWEGCQLFRGVNAEAYREIQKRELEHLVDFAYAFSLATQPIVAAVQRASAEVFSNPDEALLAVISLLDGERRVLVPKYPRAPSAWRQRCRFVTQELAGLSTARDDKNKGTHRPIGYLARKVGNEVVILPEFKPGRLSTPQIIVMTGMSPVFQELKVHADIPPVKSKCMVLEETVTMAFDPTTGKGLSMGRLEVDTEVTVVGQYSGDTMMVSVAAENAGVALVKVPNPKQQVLLEVPIEALSPP